jgi:hypothetical protein
MRRSPVMACGAIPFLLCGCAAGAVKPSPTADQLLAVQYRASAPHGAMSGPEAEAVLKAYQRDIGKPAAPPASITGEAMTSK